MATSPRFSVRHLGRVPVLFLLSLLGAVGYRMAGQVTAAHAGVVALPVNFTYSAMADQPAGVSEAQGRAWNGKAYVFGGFDSRRPCCTPTNRAQIYDSAKNVWTAIPNLPGTGFTHAGTAVNTERGYIYLAGGYTGRPGANGMWSGQIFGSRQVWLYDPGQQQYKPLPALPVELAAGQLVYVNHHLHYFGGTNASRTQDLTTHYVLDLGAAQQGWHAATPLPHARNHLGTVAFNGKIYAVGGQTGQDEGLKTVAYVDVYSVADNTWRPAAPLPRARSHISNSTFVLGGQIVVAGGETAHNVPMNDVTAYDPSNNTWTALTPLPEARSSGIAWADGTSFYFSAGNSKASGWKATPR